MAAETEQPGSDQEFTWVHCATCGTGLWKRFPDHLEIAFVRRGGHRAPKDETGAVRKRIFRVPFEAATVIQVTCEKCGAISVGA